MKSTISNFLNTKFRAKMKILKLGTNMPYLITFALEFSKNYCHNWSEHHCGKCVQIRSFFWSVFSRIRAECGEILRIFPLSLRIQSQCGKIRTIKNSLFGHFSRSAPSNFSKQIFVLNKNSQIWDQNCSIKVLYFYVELLPCLKSATSNFSQNKVLCENKNP